MYEWVYEWVFVYGYMHVYASVSVCVFMCVRMCARVGGCMRGICVTVGNIWEHPVVALILGSGFILVTIENSSDTS